MKQVWRLIMVLFICYCPGIVAAESKNDVTTTITLQNDLVLPHKGADRCVQSFLGYWHIASFGTGLDFDSNFQDGYYLIKPYLTLNKGPWFGLVGYSTNSFGDEYFQTGLWYVSTKGKFDIVADIRNYWSLGSQSDYFDAFFMATHPLSNRWYWGANIIYDYFWQDNSHWVLAGPIVGMNIHEHIRLFLRISHEWDVSDHHLSEANRIRLGVTFNF